MMLHTKSNNRSLLKLLALIPIVAIALAVNAETVTHRVYNEPQKQVPVKKGKNNTTIKMGDNKTVIQIAGTEDQKAETPENNTAVGIFEPVQGDVFDVVEEMPQYPGGPQALFKFLGENIHYPEEAEKAGIQGRVIATFVVEKNGSISQPRVVKSVDPLLDAEALRVISAMPNWKPGKQNGKAVRVKYTVPLSFRLDAIRDAGEDHLCKEDGSILEMDVETGASTVTRPLFVVNGKITEAEEVRSINPKSIERMEVMKDKAAIEKYGDKAKDGVILITLKKN